MIASRRTPSTRRWPRYPVRLPVFISAKIGSSRVTVPGLVSWLSCSGMELYGGVNLQPGDVMEVEFLVSGRARVAGVVRNRSGFCFGLEFGSAEIDPEAIPDALESLILRRHEAYLHEVRQKINQALQTMVEMRRFRKEMERFAGEGPASPRRAHK